MANMYNITKGTQNWNVSANNFMNEYFGADTGYQTTGITYVNGAKAYGSNGVGYQMLSSASGIGLIVFGSISIPSTLIDSGNSPVPIVKFPANVKTVGNNWYAPCTGGIARLMFNESANTIEIYPGYFIYNHEKPTGNVWVNVSQIFSTHK